MSIIKFIALSLITLTFNLASATMTCAGNPVCESVEVLTQVKISDAMLPPGNVNITYPMNSYVRYIAGAPMTIGATADANLLVNLSLYVNGELIIGGATGTITTSYIPQTAGLYTLLVEATYTDGSTSSQTMTFRVIPAIQTGGTGYVQLIRP